MEVEVIVASDTSPYGFIMVTVDPPTVGARTGQAWHLVRARLDGGLWPIFERTANRRRLVAGARLAFYVGGTRKAAGHIVATAVVDQRVSWNPGKGRIDPRHYATDLPSSALYLRDVVYLERPVSFKDVLPRLDMRPQNLKLWGVVLMGGCRAVSEHDWRVLLGDLSAAPE